MGLLGDVSRVILIYTCIFWVFAIVSLFVVRQGFLAIIATVFLIIPLYMVVSEHLKTKKTRKAQQMQRVL
jgi:Flp pilus assembly protein TadB